MKICKIKHSSRQKTLHFLNNPKKQKRKKLEPNHNNPKMFASKLR